MSDYLITGLDILNLVSFKVEDIDSTLNLLSGKEFYFHFLIIIHTIYR
jgi:hypothetical protein